MPTLLIMSGYPFAGKSTIARRLVDQFDLVRISLDEINGELGVGNDPSVPINPAQWDRTYAEFHVRIRRLLRENRSVIADVAGFSRKERGDLHDIAQATGTPSVVFHVRTPLPVAVERWQHNRTTKERNDVRDDDFQHVVNGFEVPDGDERVIAFDPDTVWDDFVADVKAVLEPSSGAPGI